MGITISSISSGASASSGYNSYSYPTISLSDISASGQYVEDLFSASDLLNNPYVKKYEIIESQEDLLILSCVWYRIRKNKKEPSLVYAHKASSIFDKELFKNINEEDRILANSIRDYYSKKIMFFTLQGIELTKFRQDLNTFIHSDGKKVQKDICGLVYRLPEFYFYDTKLDSLLVNCDKKIKTEKKHNDATHELEHLCTLEKTRKKITTLEYWFKNENNNLVKISIQPNNPLKDVWNQIIKNKFNMSGIYYKKTQDNVDYFRLVGFKMG